MPTASNSPTYPAPSASGGWLTALINNASQYYFGRNRLDQIAEEHQYQLAMIQAQQRAAAPDVSISTAKFPWVQWALIGGAAVGAVFLVVKYARR